MVRRSLGVALWSLVGLLACFLGALNALVGTRAGRGLLARVASEAIERAVSGTLEVGEVRGTLLTGVTLTDVRVFDADTSLVAWLPRAELSYNPFDFVAGRAVFFEVRLERPVFNIVQHPNGKLNLEEVLRLDVKRPSSGQPPALVLLRNVRIEDGSLIVRLQDKASPGDTALEIDAGGRDGRQRIRRFEHLNARLAALRISSPREKGIRADIARLAVEISDPAVTLTDVAGRITILGDSLEADLPRVRFPGSQFSARGRVRWPRDTLLFDLAMRADSATLTDIRFVDPRFPEGAVLHGGVGLRSHGGRVLEIRLDPLDVTYRGGRLTGRVTALSAADSGLVALRKGDLTASDLDLDLPRRFLDTLPFYGHLTGHTVADGPLAALGLDVDWVFRDSLVAGSPQTRIRGKGEINLDAPAGMVFQPFAVNEATVALGTVRRLVPGFGLRGTLDAVGTLTGPWTNAEFSGTLRHRDGERPVSVVRGVVRLDTRSDTLGVYADVAADTLSFDGLRGSFPGLRLRGALAGAIRLGGPLPALATHARLATGRPGGGRLEADGVLGLMAPRYGARDLTLRAHDLDLARWLDGGPPSRLTFTVTGTVAADSAAAPAGALVGVLAPSMLAGTVLDSGAARVRFADDRLYLDSLRLTEPGVTTTGAGALGWRHPAAGRLTLDVQADSLSPLDSVLTWLAGRPSAGEPDAALHGAVRAQVVLEGALDSLALSTDASGRNLRWRAWHVPAGHGRLVYRPGPVPEFALDVALDSLRHGRMGFGAGIARARGTRDSLTWFARSRVGDLGAFLAGGRYARTAPGAQGQVRVGLDSLALLVPGGVWLLEAPTVLTVSDSAVAVGQLALQNTGGAGRVVLSGDLPNAGRADAHLQIESFPLAGVYTLLQLDTLGVGGSVTATLGVAGTRATPVYAGSFALSDGAFGAFRAPFLDGTIEYHDRRLAGALHLWRSGQQILVVTTQLPVDLALTDVANRQLPDTLSIRARADSVDLSVLEAATPLLREVRGDFWADVGIAGTWEAPRLEGDLRIRRAAATISTLNVRYEDMNGRLALSGDTIRVESLSARSEKGSAEVSGFVRLERLTRPRLQLDIAARDFKALDLKGYLTVTASGELSLTGPVFGATLSGRGTVTSGVLHFADLVNKRVVNLDEPWVASLIDTSLAATIRRQRLGPEFESVFFDSLRIQNLQLTMGNDAWLRSSEANIQLTGSVTVDKRGANYVLFGTLQAPRGTYRLEVGPVTREFLVTQGTVRYFGTPDLDAELNIEARHVVHPVRPTTEDQEIKVIAHIRGTLLVPKLTLEAENRPLSQTEIISYLMFGRSSFELAGNQGALARSTVASLVSGELERTVVSDLGVPLDYFELRPGDPANPFSGAQAAAGWQIGRKTFLVLNAGFCPNRSVTNVLGASLQFRVSPEWRTEASFEPLRTCTLPGAEPQAPPRQFGLDMFWEKRY